MYSTLLSLHSAFRWLVLVSLVWAICRAWSGFVSRTTFTPSDNLLRHWTATIAHIQLVIGMLLYTQSALVKVYWTKQTTEQNTGLTFFAVVHLLSMLAAIAIITIGSASAKRKQTAQEKYFTMGIYFSMALLLILVAVPWPFSPFANRPYLRPI